MQASPDPQDPAETLPPPTPAHHAAPVWWALLPDWAIAFLLQLERSPALQQGLLSLFGHCILCGLCQWHPLSVAPQARAGLQSALCVVPVYHDKTLAQSGSLMPTVSSTARPRAEGQVERQWLKRQTGSTCPTLFGPPGGPLYDRTNDIGPEPGMP